MTAKVEGAIIDPIKRTRIALLVMIASNGHSVADLKRAKDSDYESAWIHIAMFTGKEMYLVSRREYRMWVAGKLDLS